MKKVLSLIIPTYNMEMYLDKCLTSLIISDIQLMASLEVLVVIDGAKDRSSDIAHSYQEQYPNTFQVIDKENGNYGSCINRGLAEASGKYVKVLDADDSFKTENLENFLKLLSSIDVDLVVSDFVYKNEDDQDGNIRSRKLESGKIYTFNEVVENFNDVLISMHELAYNRRVFKDFNYHQTEGISYTDLEWCFSPMSRVHTIYYFNQIIYRYLIGRAGQTVDPAVIVKSQTHKILTAETMTRLYTQIQTDNVHMKYLRRRLVWSNSDIYYSHLVYPCIKDLSSLIKFDEFVKNTSLSIYEDLRMAIASKRLPIKYIKLWRHQKDMAKPAYALSIIQKIARLVIR